MKLTQFLSLGLVVAALLPSYAQEDKDTGERSSNDSIICRLPNWREGITVIGEVKTPSIVRYRRDLTLLKAIAETGGFTDRADRANVLIIKNGKTYSLSTLGITSAKDEMLLGPKDVIIIPEKTSIKDDKKEEGARTESEDRQ